MKILHTARWFFPHTGGGSIRVYNIAKNLVHLGHEVHLLVHHPESIDQCNLQQDGEKVPLYENYHGIHVYRLPYFPPNFLYWSLSIPMMARKALQIIRRHKIDAVLSDNPPYLVGTAALMASKIAKIPMVINVHDVWGAAHYSSVQYKVGASLERFCTKRVQRFVTVSEGLRLILADSFAIPTENIGIAANAIDLARFDVSQEQISQTLEYYRLMGIFPGGKYVVFVGIMRQWAGVQYLIEAFKQVVAKYPDYKLLLVGGGGDLDFFIQLAKKFGIIQNVIFTDSQPYANIPALISVAQVACAPFPSLKVTDQKQLMSPLKVLEYMAAGKAVVASRVGGMENYISDHETGLLFPPGNIDALAGGIIELIENPQLTEKLGKQAKIHVQDEKYGWLASARVVENALNLSLNHRV